MYLKIDGRLVYLWRAVDSEGEVLDVLVQTKRNKAAALKSMRKLLKNMASSPRNWSRTICDRTTPPRVILRSNIGITPADGETTEWRIRINRPDDGNARCKVSRASDQHKDFSPFTQQLTTPSASNAISFQQGRTELFELRPCRRGAKSSPSRDLTCGFRKSHVQFSTT